MKAADTTASAAEETTAAAAEFGADNQVLAETTAAAAAETMAASADAVAGFTTDTLSRIPAAELNQALETTPALPPGPLAGGGVASEGSGNLSFEAAVAETEAAAAPVDNEPADKATDSAARGRSANTIKPCVVTVSLNVVITASLTA